MDTLGEDLLLLALRPSGTMHAQQKSRFALAGSELLELAALGRIEVVSGRVCVLDVASTGQPLLDEALADLARRGRGQSAGAWIAHNRPGLRERYLAYLAAQDAVRVERHRALGLFRVDRWYVVDVARVQEIGARLDRIAASTGEVAPRDAAFAGLVHVAGLDDALYPAGADAAFRARLRQIARRRPAEAPAGSTALPEQDHGLVTTVLMAALMAAQAASRSAGVEQFDGGNNGTGHQDAHRHDGHDGGHDGGHQGSGGHLGGSGAGDSGHQGGGHQGGFGAGGGGHHGGFDGGGRH